MSSHDIETPLAKRPPGNLKSKALIVLVIAAVVVAWGVTSRAKEKSSLATLTHEQAIPVVKLIQPEGRSTGETLTLPGTLQAYYSSSVYARVSGYLKNWSVDIGTPVKSGQVLAEIETPEIDQQLKQAQANLDTALANERLTEITSKRWHNLLSSDSVSQQEADEKSGDYDAKKALVQASRAEVERLRALEGFKHITAPFDGIVTARKTDIGALINAGHDAGHELFTVADVHKLRLYVSVPQAYATQIKVGMKAQFTVPERPGETFSGVLSDNSQAVSGDTGTVLIELSVDNKDGKLLPGEYGNVSFALPNNPAVVRLPVSALTFRKEGLRVATLTPDNRVAYRTISVSNDLGNVVEVASGLAATDRVVDNPPDSLEEGDQVKLAPAAAAPAAPAGAAKP
ncbi:MAG TPA: efflux RND transporter periplasmic adaptor subunit [Burkholderiaceae bacterium]